MSWARYDDEFPMNRKVGQLIAKGQPGIAAIGLHLLANTWARHNGTAGVIEPHVPNVIAGPGGKRLAAILVEVGMFDARQEGGWTIHDFAEYHDPTDPDPNRSAVDRKKELSLKRAEAGRRGGLAKAKQTPSKPSGKTEATERQSPSPDPVPDPTTTSIPTGLHHPTECQDDEDEEAQEAGRRESGIAERVTALRMAEMTHIKHPKLYAPKVYETVMEECAERIVQILDAFPDAPDTLIAAAVHTGDTRNLAPYAPAAPVLELVAPPPDWVRERRKPGAVS